MSRADTAALLAVGALAGLLTGPSILPLTTDEATMLALLPGYAAAGAWLFWLFLRH